MIAFLNALLLVTSPLPPHGAAYAIETSNVPSEMYWLAADASGARLCNPDLKKAQQKAFDDRYGPLVLAIAKAMKNSHKVKEIQGDELSGCRSFATANAAHQQLSRALDDFEPVIRRMQLRYNVTCWEIFCSSPLDEPVAGR